MNVVLGLRYLMILAMKLTISLPETNSKFAPENGCLEYDRFLLGFGNFSGAFAVSFREGSGW